MRRPNKQPTFKEGTTTYQANSTYYRDADQLEFIWSHSYLKSGPLP